MSTSNPTELIRQLSLGDRYAFKSLFLDYYPKVKCFIAHLIKSETTAEDLSQDIFVKIWDNRENLLVIESFNAYIYRMAKNAVINHLKREGYRDAGIDYLTREQQSQSSCEEDLFAREIELLVQLTVGKMPHQRKLIYEMSRIEGLKNEEIAQKLNISKKTVENHLNLALKTIKKTIQLFSLFFI